MGGLFCFFTCAFVHLSLQLRTKWRTKTLCLNYHLNFLRTNSTKTTLFLLLAHSFIARPYAAVVRLEAYAQRCISHPLSTNIRCSITNGWLSARANKQNLFANPSQIISALTLRLLQSHSHSSSLTVNYTSKNLFDTTPRCLAAKPNQRCCHSALRTVLLKLTLAICRNLELRKLKWRQLSPIIAPLARSS